MSSTLNAVLYWAPRIAGICATLFLALFAFDAPDGSPSREVVTGTAIHLLPATLCGVLVALSWRLPRVGATLFGLVAIGYALSVPSRLDWIALISGPLVVIALLFAWSPAHRAPAHRNT